MATPLSSNIAKLTIANNRQYLIVCAIFWRDRLLKVIAIGNLSIFIF
ncbi:MAG: hypothetical protein AB4290_26920 [Spirulina sp.]